MYRIPSSICSTLAPPPIYILPNGPHYMRGESSSLSHHQVMQLAVQVAWCVAEQHGRLQFIGCLGHSVDIVVVLN